MDDNLRVQHPSELLEFLSVPSYLSSDGIESAEPSTPAPTYQFSKQSPFAIRYSIDSIYHGLPAAVPDDKAIARNVRAATKTEHRMTLTEALHLYYKAIGWSILLSLSIVMEGFDITLITSFFAFPSFKRRYGSLTSDGSYEISSPWQSALTNGALTGEVIGLLFNGCLTDRFGNRRTMMAALIFLAAAIFLAFFANSLGMLLASQVLCGIPWGIFQTLSTTYAAECMPVSLRAYLTSNINLCWLIGQVISVSILRSLTNNSSQWAYRIPFSLQWIWIVPILFGVLFAPESPWWLIRHERPADARRSIIRLTSESAKSDFSVDEAIALMQHTNQVEKNLKVGTSYLACFQGSDLRRTEIVCMVWMTQTICGCMIGYATYFYVQAGLSTDKAFSMSIAMYGSGILGLIFSWLLMKWFGRRTLYLWGIALIGAVLLAAGLVGIRQETSRISWALGTLIVVMTFVYDCTIGPVCYSLVAEIPATRLRVKTVVLGRVAYNVLSLATNVLLSHFLNPGSWNWKGKTCFVWAGATALVWIWCWLRLPEPKGLTYMELDILFENRAPAKDFKRIQKRLANAGYFDLQMPGRRDDIRWHEEIPKLN